jgi:hypothetical protein
LRVNLELLQKIDLTETIKQEMILKDKSKIYKKEQSKIYYEYISKYLIDLKNAKIGIIGIILLLRYFNE